MTLLQLDVPLEGVSLRKITVTAPPQLSVARTEAMLDGGTSEKHVTVTGAGHVVIVGGVVSLTVIVCVQVAMLPHVSTPW